MSHSAGAGRTGAFIAIDYLLEQEKIEHNVRILDCLKELRDQRSQMIQNLVCISADKCIRNSGRALNFTFRKRINLTEFHLRIA